MIRSMTGFAAVTHEAGPLTVSVTLRSVNHRHFDLQCRVPASLQASESALRARIQQTVARGRVECAITCQARQAPTPVVEMNEALLLALDAALADVRARGLVAGTLTPGDLLRLPNVLTIREAVDAGDAAALAAATAHALDAAVEDLDAMRRREGAYLADELQTRLQALATLVDGLDAAAADGAATLERRLHERLDALRLEPQLDPALLAQEVVKFVARSDVREELVRLRAHQGHWQHLVEADEPVGRKLDFLLQEMHREVNTIGAKAEGPRVSELIVSAKAELEKMREQVQNVE